MSTVSTMRVCSAIALLLACQLALSAADPVSLPPNAVILTTKNMCCAKESVPAIKELRKIAGIQQVTANYKARTLTIVPKEGVYPSLKAMWEAVERAEVEPVRLTADGRTTEKKPLR